MSGAELTINATEFKAKCLDLMRRIETGELKAITVTKRGRPQAVIRAVEAERKPPFDWDAWERQMAAMPLDLNPTIDWSRPVLDPEALDEFERNAAALFTPTPSSNAA